MAGSGTVTVNIIGKTDKLESALDGLSGKLSKFGDKMTDVGKKMTLGVTTPVVAGMATSAKAASDFEESLNKVNVVFKGQSKEIEAWSKTAAKGVGLSSTAALDATGSFGNMFTQLGISTDAAAKMSMGMVGLASDFASFHNADISDVIEAQSAAFRGEYDSLQKYLPLINAASVEQKALQMTGKATSDELTAQDKALAVNALMHEGAGEAAGDFSRTQDSLANKTRIAKAEAENAAVSFGQALKPVTEKVAAAVGWLSEKFANLSPGMQTTILVVAGLLAALGPLITLIGALATAMAFLAANPIVLVIAGIAALAAGLIYAYQHSETFRNVVNTAFNAVKATIEWVWNNVLVHIFEAWRSEINFVIGAFNAIKGVVSDVWNFIHPILDRIGDAIGKVAGPLGKVVGAVGGVTGAVGGVIGKIFHSGGIVPGPIGSNVPIMAQAGERILPRGRSQDGPVFIQLTVDERVLGEIAAASLLDFQSRNGNVGVEAA